jgi:TusA-related sulfurtransferase
MRESLPKPAAHRVADLVGERCPYTFIKARLAIEEMRPGEVLEVRLDFAPAFDRVPASMVVIGHEIVGIWREEGDVGSVFVRKGSEVA